ncbi:glycosyltransferase family 4 protein [Lacinutrix undariae]
MIKILLDNFSPEHNAVAWLVAAFILAFLIAYRAFPTILYVAREKHLMDEPDSRSMHTDKTPTFGGIGIFLSLVVVMSIVGAMLDTKVLLLVMGGLTILFFLGLKDDLTTLPANRKFLGQLFAAALLIIFTDTRIGSFSGILGIGTLPYWVSLVFTLFVYVLVINAYNLIDGIDGLAGSVALLLSIVFMFALYSLGDLSLATICVALAGSLLAFLRMNFSTKHKIFMGDTGSMIVGFLLAFFAVSFISAAERSSDSIFLSGAPALALAMLFYPLADTFRVFFIRIIILKTSPFKPDTNHIHHRFIRAGFNHKSTTAIVVAINLLIIIIAYNLLFLNLNTQICLLFVYGSLLYSIPFMLKKQVYQNKGIVKQDGI